MTTSIFTLSGRGEPVLLLQATFFRPAQGWSRSVQIISLETEEPISGCREPCLRLMRRVSRSARPVFPVPSSRPLPNPQRSRAYGEVEIHAVPLLPRRDYIHS